MTKSTEEIQIFYNPKNSFDQKCIAHAKSLSSSVVTYSLQDPSAAFVALKEVLTQLDCHPKDLLNKQHYLYKNLETKCLNMDGWCQLLSQHPEILKAPIARKGKKAILFKRPSDIYRLTNRSTMVYNYSVG